MVTTNTTEFFRERNHFDYLTAHALPSIIKRRKYNTTGTLCVWSAGCSTGQEPYTLAMVLSDWLADYGWTYSIFATHVCTKVLDKAKRAVYDSDQVAPIPDAMKRKYLLQGKNSAGRQGEDSSGTAATWWNLPRVNFTSYDFGLDNPMDIIFCRNVLIYFDAETRAKLINRFYNHLSPNGYSFIGHSETLNGINNDFVSVAPTIYRKSSQRRRRRSLFTTTPESENENDGQEDRCAHSR